MTSLGAVEQDAIWGTTTLAGESRHAMPRDTVHCMQDGRRDCTVQGGIDASAGVGDEAIGWEASEGTAAW